MTQTAEVYAQALYSLAVDENLSRELYQQLQVLRKCVLEQPDFLRLLAASELGKQARYRILEECFSGKAHPYAVNFMKLLTEHGYIRLFPDCCEAYARRYREDQGILPVLAVTAVPMSRKQISRLEEKLASFTGKKIELTCRTDPACIGGVRLMYEGRQTDGTVKHHLDRLDRLLKNTAL